MPPKGRQAMGDKRVSGEDKARKKRRHATPQDPGLLPASLTRVLPPTSATVLDVGRATGFYAGPLAQVGYRVHMVEPVQEYAVEAAARPGATAVVGGARALPAFDRSSRSSRTTGPDGRRGRHRCVGFPQKNQDPEVGLGAFSVVGNRPNVHPREQMDW